VIPGYEYIYVEVETPDTFSDAINYINSNGLTLVGAAHDFTCPVSGKNYIFFPVKEI